MSKIIGWFTVILRLYILLRHAEGFKTSYMRSKSVTVQNCGENFVSMPRIVGGQPVPEGYIPWMVTLHEKFDVEFDHVCGGSILNERWIVTAAHCIVNPNQPELYEVYAGLHHLSRKSARRVRRHMIRRFVVHEKYVGSSHEHDIALLETADCIDLEEEHVNGVCLPAAGEQEPMPGFATIAGWGHTEHGGSKSDVLRTVEVPLTPREECNRVYYSEESNFLSNITENMLCAGSTGLDSCQADSGGPLVLWRDGRAVLFGIVSFGMGCGMEGYPGVYTRVAAYVDWIVEKICA